MSEDKNPGGRPQKRLSKEQIHEVRALAAILSKEQIASYFGMTEKTLSAIFRRQPEVFTAYKQGRANAILKVASALLRAVEEGDMRAIQFFLKTQAGWTEKRYLEINQSEVEEPEDYCLTIEMVGKNADGTQYRYSTDDAGNKIIIDHDGSIYSDRERE